MTEPSALLEYLENLEPDHEGDIVISIPAKTRDLIVAALRAAPAQGEPVGLTEDQRCALERMAAHDLKTSGLTWDNDRLLIESAAQAAKDALAAFPSSPAPSPNPAPTMPGAPGSGVGAGGAISPADLAEVLANVREGIAKVQDTGSRVPIELHRACQALSHMVKDSR